MLTSDNEFQYFHTYQELGKNGIIHPLTCQCGTPYVTVLREGSLALLCPMDNSIETPGMVIKDLIERMVDNYKEIHGL